MTYLDRVTAFNTTRHIAALKAAATKRTNALAIATQAAPALTSSAPRASAPQTLGPVWFDSWIAQAA